jgi:bacterioferritin-associated ferredoxin
MIVCLCHGVSHHDIARAVHEGCASFDELQDELLVSTACGACHDCANRVFDESVCAAAAATHGHAPASPSHELRHRAPTRQLIRMPVAGARNGAESRHAAGVLESAR